MFDKLNLLRLKGYYPDTILDIGAYKGQWTTSMKQIYGDAEYHLFEAIDYGELKEFKNVYNVLLGDQVKDVHWYQMKNTGDSMFREMTRYFADCEIIQRTCYPLDQVIDLSRSRNILIKIDCQGAEISILKGATKILKHTDLIVMELPLFGVYNEGVPTFLEHIQFMDTIGFVPYDVVDSHYINGFNMQLDMLFINKSHSFHSIVNDLLL
jgi:FkbM family methyltransferase